MRILPAAGLLLTTALTIASATGGASADWCLAPGMVSAVPIVLPGSVRNAEGASAYSGPTPSDQSVRLHAVSSYEGAGTVRVEPSDEPMVLLLNGMAPSVWKLDVAPGARLEKVWITGSRIQRVVGIPEGVPVEIVADCQLWADDPPSDAATGEGALPGRPAFHAAFLEYVKKRTGLEVSEFQSIYGRGSFVVPMRAMPTPVPRSQPRSRDPQAADAGAGAAVDLVARLVGSGLLPSERLSSGTGGRDLERISWPTAADAEASSGCTSDRDEANGIDQVDCSGMRRTLVSTGDGSDVIEASHSDDAFVPGKGDDVLDFSWGSDILVVDGPGWGKDVVYKACASARLDDRQRSRLGRQHAMTSQIVFGPGIDPDGFELETVAAANAPEGRSMKKMTYRATGDSLEFGESDCFDFVFADGEPGRNYRETMLGLKTTAPASPAAGARPKREPGFDRARIAGIRRQLDGMLAAGLLPESRRPLLEALPSAEGIARGRDDGSCGAVVAASGAAPCGERSRIFVMDGTSSPIRAMEVGGPHLVVAGPGVDRMTVRDGLVWFDGGWDGDVIASRNCVPGRSAKEGTTLAFGPQVAVRDVVGRTSGGRLTYLEDAAHGGRLQLAGDCVDFAFASGWPGVDHAARILDSATEPSSEPGRQIRPPAAEVHKPQASVRAEPRKDARTTPEEASIAWIRDLLSDLDGWQLVYGGFVVWFAVMLAWGNARRRDR